MGKGRGRMGRSKSRRKKERKQVPAETSPLRKSIRIVCRTPKSTRTVNSGKVLPNDERVLLVETSPQAPSSSSTALVVGMTSIMFTTHNTKMSFLLHKRFHLELTVVVVGLLELVKRY